MERAIEALRLWTPASGCRPAVALRNDGQGGFPARDSYVTATGETRLLPSDFNADGRTDLFLGNAFLLANHGPVVTGKDLVDAVNNMEELEETARLALMLHGHAIRYLSEPEIDELRRMKP